MVTGNTQQLSCQPELEAQLIDSIDLFRKTPPYDVRFSRISRATCAGVRTDAGLAGGTLHDELGMKMPGDCCGTDQRHIECLARTLANSKR
jgi:hypothetical protein